MYEFILLLYPQQGCQSRDNDDTEWSMGRFETAYFYVDDTNSVTLQFFAGDDDR